MIVAACASQSALDGMDRSVVSAGDDRLTVILAETPAQRQQGLRDVDALPAGVDGMLFVFERARPATFGMRDTRIPLDIWWFAADGHLLGSTEMAPCASEPCPDFGSPGAVAWALETPAGEVQLSPGDILSLTP